MSLRDLAALSILAVAACDTKLMDTVDQASACPSECPPLPDLAQPQAKCAAAKGLPGDNLLCVDFSQTTIEELKGKGWDISCDTGATWEILAGKLQVQRFDMFSMKQCHFKMPAVTATDYAKYNSFTISVLHSLETFKNKQTAGIYLGQPSDDQQIWIGTGNNHLQVTTISIAKPLLPNGGSGMYQPYFQITATTLAGVSGWQIESIAIQGGP